jgi:hypothetical protein
VSFDVENEFMRMNRTSLSNSLRIFFTCRTCYNIAMQQHSSKGQRRDPAAPVTSILPKTNVHVDKCRDVHGKSTKQIARSLLHPAILHVNKGTSIDAHTKTAAVHAAIETDAKSQFMMSGLVTAQNTCFTGTSWSGTPQVKRLHSHVRADKTL